MEFNSSTHRRHWLFTKETLREVQEETRQLAAEVCAAGIPPEGSRSFAATRLMVGDKANADAKFKTELDIAKVKAEEGESTTDNTTGGGGGKKRPAPNAAAAEPVLTVEEECLVKSYYAKKIQETCGRDSADEDLRRSDKVQATAVAFFQRFYLSNSVLEHDPKILILTCVFLASKTEEQITNVSLLAKATGRDDLQILGKELILLQGLSFQLAVFHPYRALPALVEGARLRAKAAGVPPQPERIMALHDAARAALDDILVTTLPFLHSPSRLALAALLREARRMEAPPFNVAAMLSEEFGNRKGWKEVLREADELVNELDKVLPYRVEKDKLIAVNKKLKKHALWSEKRSRGAEGGGGGSSSERRKSKKTKTKA